MNNKFGVSVVIPTHNRVKFLTRSLGSVIRQGYDPLEIILVDNGSTDGTFEWFAQFNSNSSVSFRAVLANERRGAQYARNVGIKVAKYPWVAFLDSDDEWLEGKLHYQMDFVRKNYKENLFLHSNLLLGREGTSCLEKFPIPLIEGSSAYRSLLMSTGPSFPTILTSKAILEDIGYLDESVVAYQEWETSIRLSKICDVTFFRLPTAVWWRHDSGSISDSTELAMQGYIYILRKHLPDMVKIIGLEGLEFHKRHCLTSFGVDVEFS